MAEGSGMYEKKTPVLLLGKDFGEVVLQVNGISVDVASNGDLKTRLVEKAISHGKTPVIEFGDTLGALAVQVNGDWIEVAPNGDVRVRPAANDSAVSGTTPQVGDLDGGGVYVGPSAKDGKPLHAALADEPAYLTFYEAFEAAEKMRKRPGRQNAHVPTPEELDKNLFDNRNTGHLKGTFNTSGSYPASCYRSSAPYGAVNAQATVVRQREPGQQLRGESAASASRLVSPSRFARQLV